VESASVLGAGRPRGADARGRSSRVDVLARAVAFLRWSGLAFFILGVTDVALVWLPTSFGNREWQFATVTASFNGTPVLLLGLIMVVTAASWEGRRWWSLAGGVVAAFSFLLVLGAVAIWASNVPLALQAVEGVVLTGLKKAVFKTSVQSVILPIFFGGIAFQGFRGFRSAGP
jgi:hypothetical protein